MRSRIQNLSFLCATFLLAGCVTQSINLYSLGFSKFDRLLSSSGRIGTVVMYRGENASAIQERPAVILAFENALERDLRSKGYAPVTLRSSTFATAINRFNPPPSLRQLSTEHLNSSFAAAAAQDLQYLLVVWVELKKENPTKIDRAGTISEITTAANQGWTGLVYVEAYSPKGEQLTMAPGVIQGWSPTKSDQFVVVPLEELAEKCMRTCLGALPRSSDR